MPRAALSARRSPLIALAVLLLAACTPTAATPPASAPGPTAGQPGSAGQTGGGAGQAAPVRVRVGIAGVSAALAPVWIAAKGGLYEKYGLHVEPEVLQSGTATIQGLLGGDFQFIETSGVDLLAARLGGADVRILGIHVNTIPYSIVAVPEIDEPARLRGARIGVSRLGTSSDFAARYALERIGLRPDVDATIVAAGNQATRFAALKGGAVDATVVSPPLNILSQKLGLREVLSLSALGIEYAHEGVAATGDYLRARPEVVTAFLQGYVESLLFWKTQPEQTKALLAQYLAFDPSAKEEADSLDETWQAYRDLMPDVPRPTRAGLDLIFAERPPGTDASSGAGYAGLVDDGPLGEIERGGFVDRLRAEYGR
jgi:ABC-type nitrate/sulfonate/bicarbonate transport system substrate-binding protein